MYTEFASIKRTAERAKASNLGISENAIKNWIKENKIRAVYSGNAAMVSWTSLMDFLNLSV